MDFVRDQVLPPKPNRRSNISGEKILLVCMTVALSTWAYSVAGETVDTPQTGRRDWPDSVVGSCPLRAHPGRSGNVGGFSEADIGSATCTLPACAKERHSQHI